MQASNRCVCGELMKFAGRRVALHYAKVGEMIAVHSLTKPASAASEKPRRSEFYVVQRSSGALLAAEPRAPEALVSCKRWSAA